jgi:predicted nicotinamide N-methyase
MGDNMKKCPLDLPNLTDAEKKQVTYQWEAQQHENFRQDLHLTPYGDVLHNFSVRKGVWNPFITLARYQATYLLYNNARYFTGKSTLEIGTGTGLMAVVMGLYGANKVTATDISKVALENASENVEQYDLRSKVQVLERDLFKGVDEKFDFIVFNHPFFCDIPAKGDTIAASMLAPQKVIVKFLSEARDHLNENASIMMPYFSIPGSANDPRIQGEKLRYKVKLTMHTSCGTGMQKGESFIYELKH